MKPMIEQFNGLWFPLYRGKRWGYGWATEELALWALQRMPCETCMEMDRRLCDCGVLV